MNRTIASLLPARAREWVYAILAVASSVYIPAQAIYELPVWSALVVAGVNGAGFLMANQMTSDRPVPPPA
jgi:hypothetical protein